jgi:hypothetical protein
VSAHTLGGAEKAPTTPQARLVLGPPADLERALADEVERHKAGDPLALVRNELPSCI